MFKNESFWLVDCSEWVLNRTWALNKKNENKKSAFFHKNHKIPSKIPSKIDHENPSFLLTELCAGKKFYLQYWLFIRSGCLIEPWVFNWSLFCLDGCGQEWPCIYKFPKIAGRCTKLDDEAVVFKVVSNEREKIRR